MHYFGKDKMQALERYLEQAAFLHDGKTKMFKTTNGNITLRRKWFVHTVPRWKDCDMPASI